MEDIFIKNIHINKVRHLENIDIPISETERKHLILTGKNGSGKTSVLLEIKNWLVLVNDIFIHFKKYNLIVKNIDTDILSSNSEIKKVVQEIRFLERVAPNGALAVKRTARTLGKGIRDFNFPEYSEKENFIIRKSKLSDKVIMFRNRVRDLAQEKENAKFELVEWLNSRNVNARNISLFTNKDLLNSAITEHNDYDENFVTSYFGAKSNFEILTPKGINKIEEKEEFGLDENIGKYFLQHMVNLKADRLFAREENDDSTANYISAWFDNFEKSLQEIFDDNELKLEFDRKNYSFILLNKGKTPSDFTTLSDGYSAILNIISELIMRMENKASKSYDIQGIVLIDEIETHLHIDLQKKILPFLTNFFPKIQFIVTTHSPFVLNSVSNAVIFDLEKKLLVEDLSGYSVNSIIESYFDSDDYSTIVKEKVIEYERLLTKDILEEEEEEKLFDLKEYFEDLPKMFSPELALKINQIQLANLAVK